MKTGIWTKLVFKKLLQLAQMIYHSKEYEEESRREKKKKTLQKNEAPTMAVRSILKQTEEKCQE